MAGAHSSVCQLMAVHDAPLQVAALPDYRPYSNGGGLRVRAREHVPDSHDR